MKAITKQNATESEEIDGNDVVLESGGKVKISFYNEGEAFDRITIIFDSMEEFIKWSESRQYVG
jgi:hypothetical protein